MGMVDHLRVFDFLSPALDVYVRKHEMRNASKFLSSSPNLWAVEEPHLIWESSRILILSGHCDCLCRQRTGNMDSKVWAVQARTPVG